MTWNNANWEDKDALSEKAKDHTAKMDRNYSAFNVI